MTLKKGYRRSGRAYIRDSRGLFGAFFRYERFLSAVGVLRALVL